MALGNMSLLEYAKTLDLSQPRNAMIMMLATSHPIFAVMPVETIASGVKKWNLVSQYSNTTEAYAARNFGADYSATKTEAYSMTSEAKIYGGKIRTDRALIARDPIQGQLQLNGAIASRARALVHAIFEGSGGTYITGIQKLIDDNIYKPFNAQYVDCGTATTSAIISDDVMLKALAMQNTIPGKTFIFGSKLAILALKKLSRGNASTGQNIPWNPAQFGMTPDTYDGYPLIPLVDSVGDTIISTTRCTSADGSYMYIVTFGQENFTGFQVEAPQVLNLSDKTSLQDVEIEWQIGTAAVSKRCITAIRYVKEALA
jgi:hypothetical protein